MSKYILTKVCLSITKKDSDSENLFVTPINKTSALRNLTDVTATPARGNVSDNIRGVHNTTLANAALGRGSYSMYSMYSMKPIIPI